MVQAFTIATMGVGKELGLTLRVDKKNIGPGMNASASCAAALIGVVGDDIKGSVTLLTSQEAFRETISTMSGGMIKEPRTDDPMAMSALGELANMVCGSALKELAKSNSDRMDITPPQLFSGDNLRSIPSDYPGIKYFTIPLTGNGDNNTIFVILGFQ
jgi:chemotaxis protein CheX